MVCSFKTVVYGYMVCTNIWVGLVFQPGIKSSPEVLTLCTLFAVARERVTARMALYVARTIILKVDHTPSSGQSLYTY